MKGLLLAAFACAVAGACARSGEITGADAAGPRMNEGAPPPQDPAGGAAQSDTGSGGRWGGFIGSGG
ncbi:hypothetical protein [Longimicrobium sp.]|uniref:hypothetical protein n=1 Tax=Longimicrobium sp. TaxID=2029185 RepID=UPI003B3A7EE4